MIRRRPEPVVEVIYPSTAPHLRQIAADVERKLLRHMESLPPDALCHLLRVGAEIAKARDEYERFRRQLGVQRKANAGSDS